MSLLHLDRSGANVHFDLATCKAEGEKLADTYRDANPFPHIVMDDFLDSELLKEALADFPATDGKTFFDRDQERLKYQFMPEEVRPGLMRNLLNELNSRAFVSFLEAMTGIKGLIPDPHFSGGGLHETRRGGHLGVHADFNVHGVLKLERRLNLLIYLNEDWSPDFGGELELWDTSMQSCVRKVAPIISRAVVFNTALDSYHGHPEPLTCPPERARRSIATYYYSAPEEGVASLPRRTTAFRTRPGTTDKRDYRIKLRHWMNDWVPPKLLQIAKGRGHTD